MALDMNGKLPEISINITTTGITINSDERLSTPRFLPFDQKGKCSNCKSTEMEIDFAVTKEGVTIFCSRIRGSRFVPFDHVIGLPGYTFFKIKNKGRVFNVNHGFPPCGEIDVPKKKIKLEEPVPVQPTMEKHPDILDSLAAVAAFARLFDGKAAKNLPDEPMEPSAVSPPHSDEPIGTISPAEKNTNLLEGLSAVATFAGLIDGKAAKNLPDEPREPSLVSPPRFDESIVTISPADKQQNILEGLSAVASFAGLFDGKAAKTLQAEPIAPSPASPPKASPPEQPKPEERTPPRAAPVVNSEKMEEDIHDFYHSLGAATFGLPGKK